MRSVAPLGMKTGPIVVQPPWTSVLGPQTSTPERTFDLISRRFGSLGAKFNFRDARFSDSTQLSLLAREAASLREGEVTLLVPEGTPVNGPQLVALAMGYGTTITVEAVGREFVATWEGRWYHPGLSSADRESRAGIVMAAMGQKRVNETRSMDYPGLKVSWQDAQKILRSTAVWDQMDRDERSAVGELWDRFNNSTLLRPPGPSVISSHSYHFQIAISGFFSVQPRSINRCVNFHRTLRDALASMVNGPMRHASMDESGPTAGDEDDCDDIKRPMEERSTHVRRGKKGRGMIAKFFNDFHRPRGMPRGDCRYLRAYLEKYHRSQDRTGALLTVMREMEELTNAEPASLVYLVQQMKSIPDDPKAVPLSMAVRATLGLIRRWPRGKRCRGDRLSYYYVNQGNERLFKNTFARVCAQKTREVIFRDDGRVVFVDHPIALPADRIASLFKEESMQGRCAVGDQQNLERFVAVPFSKASYKGEALRLREATTVCDLIRNLTRLNPDSLPFLFKEIERSLSTATTSQELALQVFISLQKTALFLERHADRIKIEGPAFLFYYRNAGNLQVFKTLASRLSHGQVIKLIFNDQGGYEAVNREEVKCRSRQGLSYRRRTSLSVHPNPYNNWCAVDLAEPLEEVQHRVHLLYERIERRLRVRPIAMIQRGIDSYYEIRRGTMPCPDPFLTDEFLGALRVSPVEAERLRHFNTLLRLHLARYLERGRGPYYGSVGKLFRYWRLLAGVPINDLEDLLRREGILQGNYDLIECGWRRLDDRLALVKIAGKIGLPRAYERSFVDYLLQEWHRVDEWQRSFHPTGKAIVFPNDEWDIPFFHWDPKKIRAALVIHVRQAREATGLTQDRFAQTLGLGYYEVANAEIAGTFNSRTFQTYLGYFGGKGDEETRNRLRTLRASLALHQKPVKDDGAAREAGRLLRFSRLLVPDLEIRHLCEAIQEGLGIAVSRLMYQYYEQGWDRMPLTILTWYSGLLVQRGILRSSNVPSFVEHIETIYNAMGAQAADPPPYRRDA